MAEAIDPGEDGVFPFVTGLHAGAAEMFENEILKVRQFRITGAELRQIFRGDRLVALQRFHGEGTGDTESGLVFGGLVVERLFGGRLVVRNAAKRDVGHLLVFEPLAEIAVLLIVEFVERKLRGKQSRLGDIQGDPGGVDRDPAAAPLFRDVGSCSGTAGRIEDKIAGVGGHEDASRDRGCRCLDYIDFRVAPTLN